MFFSDPGISGGARRAQNVDQPGSFEFGMVASVFGRRVAVRKISVNFLVGLALLLSALGYVYFLRVEDADAVGNLTELRHSDPVHYLENIRHQKGFHAYVAEYTKTNGYEHLNREVPTFLLGRWALFDQPKRVGDQFIAEDCSNALVIEDGMVKTAGAKAAAYPARYRIDGDTVEAHLGGRNIMSISLVSYDMDLHHIVVTLPGQTKPSYGYICK